MLRRSVRTQQNRECCVAEEAMHVYLERCVRRTRNPDPGRHSINRVCAPGLLVSIFVGPRPCVMPWLQPVLRQPITYVFLNTSAAHPPRHVLLKNVSETFARACPGEASQGNKNRASRQVCRCPTQGHGSCSLIVSLFVSHSASSTRTY